MADFNTLWNAGTFKNSFADIVNNAFIKNKVEDFCTKYLSNVLLLEIGGYQLDPNDSIIISVIYNANDGCTLRKVTLSFFEGCERAFPSHIGW
jgi:hypothetical protein